jgi:hypothetical protein
MRYLDVLYYRFDFLDIVSAVPDVSIYEATYVKT